MKIIIDADACPRSILRICQETACEYALPLYTVASFNHDISSDHHVTVDSGPQQTDLAVINMAEKGDIVVTQDWGLAALVLGKGARAVSPRGKIFTPEGMDFLLEERELKAKLRRGGYRTKGPPKHSRQDDERFSAALRKLLARQAGS